MGMALDDRAGAAPIRRRWNPFDRPTGGTVALGRFDELFANDGPLGQTDADLPDQPFLHLWAAVLWQAIADLRGGNVDHHDRADAIRWVQSRKISDGSFEFICSLFRLDAAGVRDSLMAERADWPPSIGRDERPADYYRRRTARRLARRSLA